MNDSTLSNIFKQTFYYSELVQAGDVIDLVKAPVPFDSMITREEFFVVQDLSRARRRASKLSRKPFLPLRYMVFCDVCHHEKPMQVGRSTGRDDVSRLYYNCLNKDCTRKRGHKSIRGKLVFDEIDKVVKEKLLSLPDEAYDEYLKEVKEYSNATKN